MLGDSEPRGNLSLTEKDALVQSVEDVILETPGIDSAFAFACNSRNAATVAQHNVISFKAPARRGDLLTARATERSLAGRSGIYDVTVINQDNVKIAEFRGFSRAIGGVVFDES